MEIPVTARVDLASFEGETDPIAPLNETFPQHKPQWQ